MHRDRRADGTLRSISLLLRTVSSFETIESQAAAYSEGDLDRWLSYYTEDATFGWPGARLSSESTLAELRAAFAARDQWIVNGACEQIAEVRVACPFLRVDDFHGVAGITHEAVMAFRFNEDDDIVRAVELGSFNYGAYTDFDVRFFRWLGEAHPEVAAGFGEPVHEGMPNATDMPVALQYVDEFVAQSDEYPVSEAP